MGKIDLHCHSEYSDGDSSIYEIARKCEELGYCAACITDHDYMIGTVKKYHKQRDEVDQLNASGKLLIPVILGCEIQLGFCQEGLLYGRDAIKKWFKESSIAAGYDLVYGFKYPDLTETYFNGINYAIIMAHPSWNGARDCLLPEFRWGEYNEEKLKAKNISDAFALVHGFEITCKGGSLFTDNELKMVRRLYPMRTYTNSDAHQLVSMGNDWNEVDMEIKNENDLVSWIRLGKL